MEYTQNLDGRISESPEDKEEEYIPGSYFELVKDLPHKDTPKVGTLFLFREKTEKGFKMSAPGSGIWNVDLADIGEYLVFAPDGAKRRAAEIELAKAAMEEEAVKFTEVREAVAAFSPHFVDGKLAGVLESGGEDPPQEVSNSLVLSPTNETEANLIKRAVARNSNALQLGRISLEKRSNFLRALIEEQKDAMMVAAEEAMRGARGMIAKLEEQISTVNIYLGKGEGIVCIRQGTPAAPDAPLTIRQLVLFMNEECTAEYMKGGIDANSMEKFDDFLLADPANLAQVFPEEKGIVALVPRRDPKKYNDPWMAKTMNGTEKEKGKNFKTYFLIRNGENIYRLTSEFAVGKTLLPTKAEFEEIYFTDKYVNGKRTRVPVEPGSKAYMEAMGEDDLRRRHYFKLALLLQGILDRTTIFHPMPRKINICNPADYGDFIKVVNDADLALSDGRERFADWFKRVNSKLSLGCRIVGNFRDYEHGLPRSGNYRDRCERIFPERSSMPDSGPHTITSKKGSYFVFSFDRGEIWDQSEGYRQSKTRGTCKILPTDKCFLNVDAATEEEIGYFLNSRLDRAEYEWSFPILRETLEVIRSEKEAEKPFHLLLAGEIVRAHSVDFEEATAAVPSLVSWWKFKNQTHRSLSSDDRKALEMIVEEFGIRKEREGERSALEEQKNTVLALARGEFDLSMIAIVHKKGKTYSAIFPIKPFGVFVKEVDFKLQNGQVKVIEEFPHRTLGGRAERWDFLWKSENFDEDLLSQVPYRHLTPPEALSLVGEAKEVMGDDKIFLAASHKVGRKGDADNILVYFFSIVESGKDPELRMRSLDFRRDGKGLILEPPSIYYGNYSPSFRKGEGFRPQGRYFLPWREEDAESVLLEEDLENAKAFFRAHGEFKFRSEKFSASYSVWCNISKVLKEKAEKVLELEAFREYILEYGDADLWEGHKASRNLKFNFVFPDSFENSVRETAYRGEDFSGLSVREFPGANLSAMDEKYLDLELPVGGIGEYLMEEKFRRTSPTLDFLRDHMPREFLDIF